MRRERTSAQPGLVRMVGSAPHPSQALCAPALRDSLGQSAATTVTVGVTSTLAIMVGPAWLTGLDSGVSVFRAPQGGTAR